MNKRNYSVNEAEKQELVRISQSVRKEIICAMSKAGIFQRKRKLTSYTLLFEALYRYLVDGLSFYQPAGYIDCRYHVKLSVTAWKKQLYKAIPILREIVEEYMAKHAMSACKARERQNTYALDATAFSIEGHNGTCVRVHAQVSVKDGRSANSGSKKVRKKACKNQTTLQKRTLLHANWVFLMTTLRHIPTTKLFEIYRQRWQIEIYFKRAKTLLGFHRARRGSRRYAMLMTQLWSSFALLLSICQLFFSDSTASRCSGFHSFALLSLLWA